MEHRVHACIQSIDNNIFSHTKHLLIALWQVTISFVIVWRKVEKLAYAYGDSFHWPTRWAYKPVAEAESAQITHWTTCNSHRRLVVAGSCHICRTNGAQVSTSPNHSSGKSHSYFSWVLFVMYTMSQKSKPKYFSPQPRRMFIGNGKHFRLSKLIKVIDNDPQFLIIFVIFETVEKSRFIIISLTTLLYHCDQTSTRICLTALAPYFDQVLNWAFVGCSTKGY